jgi:hypothetical protein
MPHFTPQIEMEDGSNCLNPLGKKREDRRENAVNHYLESCKRAAWMSFRPCTQP